MTATLVAKGLAAAHGDRTLFTDLDLVVAPGDVIGLVGANGAGKSTLLRILAGLRRAGGRSACRVSPPTATIGHLPQEPERRPGETVREFLGAADRRRRGPAGRWTRRRTALAAGRAGRRRRLHRRPRALARPRRRRPRRAGRRGRGRPRARRRPRPADDLAVRRPGRARRARVAAAQPVRHLPARRADQRPRPGRAGIGWRSSSPGCGPGPWWSATTGSSSPVR